MSLDVYLMLDDIHIPFSKGSGIYIREDGATIEISEEEFKQKFPDKEPTKTLTPRSKSEVYWANITHNLSLMASKAGIYEALWCPQENGWEKAKDIILVLETGLERLKIFPTFYQRFNPDNKWGSYEQLVAFVEEYLEACKQYPEAEIKVWK